MEFSINYTIQLLLTPAEYEEPGCCYDLLLVEIITENE